MPSETVIELAAPIMAGGESLTQLRLRRPSVKELRECGQPYMIVSGGGGGGVQADYQACARLIAAICAIPLPAVDQLDAADFDEAALVLVGFTKRVTPSANGAGSPSAS